MEESGIVCDPGSGFEGFSGNDSNLEEYCSERNGKEIYGSSVRLCPIYFRELYFLHTRNLIRNSKHDIYRKPIQTLLTLKLYVNSVLNYFSL